MWTDRTTAEPSRDPLLKRIRYRQDGDVYPTERSLDVYAALARTPSVSLYGSSKYHDDLAESINSASEGGGTSV